MTAGYMGEPTNSDGRMRSAVPASARRAVPPLAPLAAPRWAALRAAVLALLALAVVVAGVFLAGRSAGEPLALVLLAVLAAIGLAGLLAAAAGLIAPVRARPEAFGELIVDSAGTGYAVADANGDIVFANQAYRSIFGFEDGATLTSPEQVLAGHREASESLYRLTEAAGRQAEWSEDIRLITVGREEPRWLRVQVRPLGETGEEGEAGGVGSARMIWNVADISGDSVRQEDTFRELQQIINYLDHAPVGFFSLRPDGRIAYLNATLAGWLGVSLDKTTGGAVAIDEILAGTAGALLRNHRAASGGTRVETFDVDLARADGKTLPVRILHRVAFDSAGAPRASRSVVLSRARGRDGDEDLRAAEVRFARFFNNAPIGIATLDASGTVTGFNPAFARIFASRNMRGGTLPQMVDEESRLALTGLIARAAGGEPDISPLDVTFGGNRTGQVFVSRTEDARDGSIGLLAYTIETTEQRSLEAQFAQSQKMQAIGQLAGGVAHDFNNVLTAIIGFSDLLLANHRPTDPSFPDIMNIKQNANRAAGLVRQLLAFSRRQTLRPEVLSLTDVIADLSVLLKRLLGETIELDVQHGRDVWLVKADLNQFEQVIINLVVNARDAMDAGGTVTIRTFNVPSEKVGEHNEAALPVADYVVIEVTDTGMGISKDNLEKIFEPFFSTKEVGKGTGLGLSTVYGIIKQTGGYIFVDSPGEDEGATFRIFLPRHVAVEGEAEPTREIRDSRPKADLTGNATVLLVEDEDAVRAFAARALEARGYTVLPAQSGEQALELVDEVDGAIDLVVSDVVMPEMDGPTLLKELRKRSPDLKIIFISGYAEEAFRKSLGDEERFRFLPKPFSLKQLAQAVKDALDAS